MSKATPQELSPPPQPPRKVSRLGTLLRLAEFVRPVRLHMAGAVTALVLSSANNMNTPRVVGMVIDTSKRGACVHGLVGKAMAVFALGAVASWVRVYLFHRSRDKVTNRLRAKVYAALANQDTEVLDEQQVGKLMKVVSDDVRIAAQAVTSDIARGLRSLSSTIGGTVMLFRISPVLTGVSLAVFPVAAASAMVMSKFVKRQQQRYNDLVAVAEARAEECLSGFHTVRLHAAEDREVAHFEALLNESLGSSSRLASAEGAYMGGLALVMSGTLMVVLVIGGGMVSRQELTAGKLTSFGLYSGLLGLGAGGLASFVMELSKSMASVKRVLDVLDAKPRIDRHAGKCLPTIQGHIRFDNVTFRYASRPDTDVLAGFSLEVMPGQVVALVGASGCGKSTVVSLLARLYSPSSGRVIVDGNDVEELQPSALRCGVCVVEQRPALFSGTLADNIKYGKPDATDEELSAAVWAANLGDFVESLEHKLQTQVGKGGCLLSGGQAQRVALARAVLRNPSVLVLDEATSNLDRENEKYVHEAIKRLMKGRTVIIVAHTPAILEHADAINVIQGGKIVETGTFAQLSANSGSVFAQLMQQRDGIDC